MYRLCLPKIVTMVTAKISARDATKKGQNVIFQQFVQDVVNNINGEVNDRTITVKFTVPGIAGSGTGIGSVRYYSTRVNDSNSGQIIEPPEKIEDRMVLEYNETLKRSCRVCDLEAENKLLRRQLKEKDEINHENIKTIGKLETQLENMRDLLQDVMALVDLRYDYETKFTKYWLLTPQSKSWKQDTITALNQHFGIPTTLSVNPSQIPTLQSKIKAQFEESFIKWVYIISNSMDPFLVAFRTNLSFDEIIRHSVELVYVLTIVHNATHKIIPSRQMKIHQPSTEETKIILRDIYRIEESSICAALRLLQKN